MDLLTKKIKEIELPDDMRKRIIRNCSDIGEAGMKVRKANNIWKKQLPIAAALVLCVCITGVTALAATGKLEGVFKDIKNWNGAIVGTSYEQATGEITVNIEEAGDELGILVSIINPEKPPYSESELFGIQSYRIEDMSGNVIVKERSLEERTAFSSQMSLNIPLNEISNGKYKLIIEQFISEKKADQPLIIYGNWECAFEY